MNKDDVSTSEEESSETMKALIDEAKKKQKTMESSDFRGYLEDLEIPFVLISFEDKPNVIVLDASYYYFDNFANLHVSKSEKELECLLVVKHSKWVTAYTNANK